VFQHDYIVLQKGTALDRSCEQAAITLKTPKREEGSFAKNTPHAQPSSGGLRRASAGWSTRHQIHIFREFASTSQV